ncbi:hypothetical protein EV174_007148, partial [Coemansia sp. RSA 2320]
WNSPLTAHRCARNRNVLRRHGGGGGHGRRVRAGRDEPAPARGARGVRRHCAEPGGQPPHGQRGRGGARRAAAGG